MGDSPHYGPCTPSPAPVDGTFIPTSWVTALTSTCRTVFALEASHFYSCYMVWLLVLLLVLWLVLAILGFVIKGLMWLAWVAIILIAVTLVVGFVAGVFTGSE